MINELQTVTELDIDLNDVLMKNMEHIIKMTGQRLTSQDFAIWDSPLGDKVGMTDKEFLNLAYKTPSTQLAAAAHSGAREFLTGFQERGNRINIVTATCLSEKQIIGWLQKYRIPFDRIIRTSDKTSDRVLIDDNPKTLTARVKAGLSTIKFLQTWNKDIACPWSISSWQELTIA